MTKRQAIEYMEQQLNWDHSALKGRILPKEEEAINVLIEVAKNKIGEVGRGRMLDDT